MSDCHSIANIGAYWEVRIRHKVPAKHNCSAIGVDRFLSRLLGESSCGEKGPFAFGIPDVAQVIQRLMGGAFLVGISSNARLDEMDICQVWESIADLCSNIRERLGDVGFRHYRPDRLLRLNYCDCDIGLTTHILESVIGRQADRHSVFANSVGCGLENL